MVELSAAVESRRLNVRAARNGPVCLTSEVAEGEPPGTAIYRTPRRNRVKIVARDSILALAVCVGSADVTLPRPKLGPPSPIG